MIHAKVDVDLRDHERAYRAGDAMALWLWGLLVTRGQERDGFIPAVAIRGAWMGENKARKHAVALVTVGLWEVVEDGWLLCKYAEKGNETKAEIDARRRDVRERVSRFRGKRPCNEDGNALVTQVPGALVPGSGSGSVSSGSDQGGAGGAEPGSGVRHRVVGPDGECGALFAAWSDGIREATGIPQSGLSPSDRRELVAMANAHAGGATDQALLDWARSTAAAFARTHDPTYGGFVPLQARKWLDGGRRPRARSGPIVQSADNRAWKLPEGLE